MSFPLSPNDGDLYTTSNGIIYRYYLSEDKWLAYGTNLGATGAQGTTGLQGAAGPTGIQGLTGAQGSGTTGLGGVTGFQGVTGLAGNQGVTGVQGTAGNINYTGAFNISAAGYAYLTTGAIADIYLPSRYQFWGWRVTTTETGSMSFTLNKSTYANFPTMTSMTTGGTAPFTSLALKNEGTTSGWAQPTGAEGDVLRVIIGSITGIYTASLALKFTRY